MGLVDASLKGNFSVDEANRYIKIAFLCTQDDPKSRPSMSTIVNMLKGDVAVDEMKISKPGLLSELSRTYKSTPNESSTGLGKEDDVFVSVNETMSYGTITFTSIEDRKSWVPTFANLAAIIQSPIWVGKNCNDMICSPEYEIATWVSSSTPQMWERINIADDCMSRKIIFRSELSAS